MNRTNINKLIWSLKDIIHSYTTEYEILSRAKPHLAGRNCCYLCIEVIYQVFISRHKLLQMLA